MMSYMLPRTEPMLSLIYVVDIGTMLDSYVLQIVMIGVGYGRKSIFCIHLANDVHHVFMSVCRPAAAFASAANDIA